jgi:HD superfamily phosphohydrolase
LNSEVIPALKFTSSLRDSVYGTVPVTTWEQEILRLPLVTRLKSTKQLGLAYLAFSGGNHTRFEHSIGTMHIAYLMSQGIGLRDSEIEMIRIAALLHDVGHPPFSHCVEFAFKMFGVKPKLTHEDVTYDKILNDVELIKIIRQHHPIVHIEDIAKLASGRYHVAHFNSILSGPIDADKIDYILRDNYHCGFPVALDVNTITEILSTDPEGKRGLLIKPEGRSFAEQLFIARYHLITKIHHDKTNRLATYLMALTLNEAWNKNKDPSKIIKNMFYEWTEGELLTYLSNEVPESYASFRDFMLGKETLREIGNLGYHELSPYGRYNAAILSSNPSYLPSLSAEISKHVKNKRVYVDAFIARPPDLSLSISAQPSVYLIDTPLVRGAVQSSLSDVHLAVYSQDDIGESDFDYAGIIDLYRKNLDDTLNEAKAESLIKNWFDGNKAEFCLRHVVEYCANRSTIAAREKLIPPSDLILLTLQAIYEVFMEHFKLRVYVDSLSNLADLYLQAKEASIFKRSDAEEILGYNLQRIEEKGRSQIAFDPNLFIDLELLETFGLIYRLSRVNKYGAKFTQKYQYRVSGWARGYHQRNLCFVRDELALLDRLKTLFNKWITEQEQAYKKYIDLMTRAEVDRDAEREAERIRKDELTIKVVF